jgi:branched-chain amino acid transport system substrate-binding protein
MKKIYIFIILIALILLVTQTKKQSSTSPFTIGVSIPLTGSYGAYGEEFRRGAELAAKEINSENPNSVELIFEDTSGDSKKALFGVKKLIESNHINAELIASYNEIAASWKPLEDAKIPSIVLWDSNPAIEDMGDYVFAIGPWTPSSGEVPAEYLYNKGIRKIAILSFNQEWGVSVSNALENKFTSLGGTITNKEFPAPETKDFRSLITKILKDNPEAIYFPTDSVYEIVKQVRTAGFKGILVTSDVLDSEVVNRDPSLFEGVLTSQVSDPVSSTTDTYLKAYKKEFGFDAKKIVIGTWAYDGVKVLYEASQKGTLKEVDLKNGLYKVNQEGASSKISFDSKGSSRTINKMFIVNNGKIIPISN